RTWTSVASARPMVTCRGGVPPAPATSPRARSLRRATLPFASVTSTQESAALARNATRLPATGSVETAAVSAAGAAGTGPETGMATGAFTGTVMGAFAGTVTGAFTGT